MIHFVVFPVLGGLRSADSSCFFRSVHFVLQLVLSSQVHSQTIYCLHPIFFLKANNSCFFCWVCAGIFGMNLRSYLEEQAVSHHQEITYLQPLWYHHFIPLTFGVFAVCILVNNGWNHHRRCSRLLPHVFISQ